MIKIDAEFAASLISIASVMNSRLTADDETYLYRGPDDNYFLTESNIGLGMPSIIDSACSGSRSTTENKQFGSF
jgi:hypothetical protein